MTKKQIFDAQLIIHLPTDFITLQVSVVADTVNVYGQSNQSQLKVPECRLADDLSALLERAAFSDVTLCVNGQEFKAHTAILAGRMVVNDMLFWS